MGDNFLDFRTEHDSLCRGQEIHILAMDSYNTNNKQDKQNKPHTTARYKPFLNAAPKSENPQLKIREQRAAEYIARKHQLDKDSEEVIDAALKTASQPAVFSGRAYARHLQNVLNRKTKSENRKAYHIRTGKDNLNRDLTDPANKVSLNFRVLLYAQKHFCPCGLKFNIVQLKDGKFHFSCDHHDTIRTLHKDEESKCSVCGFMMKTTLKNKTCKCKSWLCARCKRQTYIYKHNGNIHHQNFDKHSDGHDNIVFSIENKEEHHTDFGHFLRTHTVTKVENPNKSVVTEKSFASMVQRVPVSQRKAARKQWFNELREQQAKPKAIQDVKTTPEAGYSNIREMGCLCDYTEMFIFPLMVDFELEKKHIITFRDILYDECTLLVPLNYNEGDEPMTFVEWALSTDELVEICYPTEFEMFQKALKTFTSSPQYRESYIPGTTTNIDEVETEPQGGTISSVTTPAVKAFEAVLAAIKKMKESLIDSMGTAIKNIVKNRLFGSAASILIKTFKALIYFLSVAYDYISIGTPLNIYMMYQCIKSNNYGKLILLLGAEFATFRTRQELALHELSGVLTKRELVNRKMIDEAMSNHNFGLLDTIANYEREIAPFYTTGEELFLKIYEKTWIKSETNFIQRQIYKYPKTASDISTAWKKVRRFIMGSEEVETTEEAGFGDLISGFCEVFKNFPKAFSDGAFVLSKVARELLPLLMFSKVSWDVGKIVTNIVDTISKFIFGKAKDPRAWVQAQVGSAGNPIHDLVKIYLTYSHVVAGTKDVKGSNQLRADFYTILPTADQYALDNGAFPAWVSFKKQLVDSFNTPPRAEQREFEPTVLVLSGNAGTGKSTIWKALIAHEVIDTNSKEDALTQLEDQTCTWNSASEFQVNLVNKKVILFDDFQQDKTVNTEALSLIHLATVAPYAINSPNITGPEIKGCFAEPEIIVACTNQRVEQAAGLIADTEALRRRYDIDIELVNRFDPKDPKQKIGKIVHCNQYSSLIGKMVDLDEARQIFTVVHRAKRARFAKTNKMMHQILEDRQFLKEAMKMPLTSTLEPGMSKWQLDENFLKDFEQYVATRPQGDEYLGIDFKFYFTVFSDLLISGFVTAVPMTIALSFVRGIDILYSGTESLFSLTKLKKILTTITKCAVASVCSILAVFATFEIWYHTTQGESGTTKTAKSTQQQVTVPQGGNNTGDFISLTPLFRNATGSIRRTADGFGVNCIFIRGTYILTVRHFFMDLAKGEYVESGTEMSITKSNWNGNWKTFTFDPAHIIHVKGNITSEGMVAGYREDIVIYELPNKGFSAEKDIIRHFWKGDYSVLNFEVCKHDWIHETILGEYKPTFEDSVGIVTSERIRTGRVEGSQRTYHILAEATYAGRSSSCGSIVRIAGQSTPILGIHVAAGVNTKKSYFHFVTSTALEDALKNRLVIQPIVSDKVTVSQNGPTYMPPNSVLHFEGNLAISIWQTGKTDLQKSLVFEAIGPHITEPAALVATDSRFKTPMDTNEFYGKLFAGFRQREGFFEEAELRWAVSTMRDDILRVQAQSIVQMKELTLDECINGLDIPDNTRMDMTTSCGYPYMGRRKTDLFSENQDKRLIACLEVENAHFINNEALARGLIPFVPFILTLKDERLKMAKIIEPRTRVFANGSVQHYLLMRQHFYTMLMTFYHAKKSDLWCIPSLDRLSLDWHEYASNMLEVGDVGFDFDFKNYDRTLSHLIISESVDLLLTGATWLTPIKRKALIEMIATPTMIWGKHVFTSNGVNMSGCLLTYILNCTANELMHRAAFRYLSIKNAPLYSSSIAYKANVRGIRGGDDTVTTVSDHIAPWYNGVTVANYLNNRGMEVTSAEKDKEIQPLTNFFEMSFLKNKTGQRFGYFIPLCDLNSLIESCYWVRLNKYNRDIVKATQDNCNASLRGIFFHGNQIFDEIRSKLLEAEPRLVLATFEELSSIWAIFFRFPLHHSDFATKAVQQNNFESDAQPHKIRQGITSEESEKRTNMDTEIQTRYESGDAKPMDKAKITENAKPDAKVDTKQEHYGKQEIKNVDLGAQDKTETLRVGTTVQDSAQVSVNAVSTGDTKIDSVNQRGENYVNDVNWDLARLEKKFTQVGSFTWTTANNVGDILFSSKIITDILKTAAQKAPVDVTQFLHFSQVTMKMVAKFSPMYSGMLLQGFAPLALSPTIPRLVNMGGSIFKCSQDEGIEFTIPFRHWKGFIEVPKDEIGVYHIYCMAPLRTGGTNINNIEVVVYACIEGLEFKVPDIIPAASYFSRKLDTGMMVVVDTIPEAGVQVKQKNTICNINDHVTKMASTMLCAGKGLVGQNPVPHFQDGMQDMVTGFKRFRCVANNIIFLPGLKRTSTYYNIREIYDIASASLAQMFAAYRGSVMMRVTLFPAESHNPESNKAIRGKIWYEASSGSAPTHEVGNFFGTHYFNTEQPAQIMLPWLNQFFIAPYNVDTYPQEPFLHIDFVNPTADDVKMTYMIELALGDDFHVGIFVGGDTFYFPTQQSLFSRGHEYSEILWTDALARETTPESGIIQFIDRALETAVPIVEKMSALGLELDAHPVTSQPEPVQIRKMPYGIAADLVNYKETLMTLNHNGMSNPDQECFGVKKHEANIYDLLTETKSPIKWLQWDTGMKTGTVLWKTPVGPSSDFGTLHDQLPQSHQFWNGCTRYIFDISASQMHRGQLMFVYSVNLPSPAFKDATQTYFTTFDLTAGRATIAIDCPYLSTKPYLFTPKVTGSAFPGMEFSPGNLTLYVQNPLRGTETVDKTVDVVVYKTYLKDFRLAVFGPNYNIPPPAGRRTENNTKAIASAKKK